MDASRPATSLPTPVSPRSSTLIGAGATRSTRRWIAAWPGRPRRPSRRSTSSPASSPRTPRTGRARSAPRGCGRRAGSRRCRISTRIARSQARPSSRAVSSGPPRRSVSTSSSSYSPGRRRPTTSGGRSTLGQRLLHRARPRRGLARGGAPPRSARRSRAARAHSSSRRRLEVAVRSSIRRGRRPEQPAATISMAEPRSMTSPGATSTGSPGSSARSPTRVPLALPRSSIRTRSPSTVTTACLRENRRVVDPQVALRAAADDDVAAGRQRVADQDPLADQAHRQARPRIRPRPWLEHRGGVAGSASARHRPTTVTPARTVPDLAPGPGERVARTPSSSFNR